MRSASAAVYMASGTDGYELCCPVDRGKFETINMLVNGMPRLSTWDSLPVEIVTEDRGRKLVASDSPWLGSHALVFKKAVVDLVGPMLSEYGELLPLRCPQADLLMYNATRVLDALDERTSTIRRFAGGGIMMIERHVFRPDVLGTMDIFRIPNLRVSPIFLSRRFVDLWSSAGLKGLDFRSVWTQT